MASAPAYHSALYPPASARASSSRVCFVEESGNAKAITGYALVHDLFDGDLPAEYDACNVLYTDLPWSHGFAVFEERAGIEQSRTYAQFLARVGTIVEARALPTVLVTGRQSLRLLPRPSSVYCTRLNGAQAIAAAYGLELQQTGTATEILKELATRFQCVGDFCCGYGRSARVFHRAGKRFVVSDYNPVCIGYLVETWNRPNAHA